ncbi:MAG TPA: hypothetical protein VFN35_00200, partial [Ktedonobacteraceae bacterium]|nr:hypothetical protein [Ktedonobacteraceae bacterium]
RALLLARAEADIATILDLTEDETNEVQQLAPAFSLEELTECARLFAQNELMQRNSATPQLGLELAALECIELHRRVSAGGTIAKEPVKVTETLSPPVRPQAPPQTPREIVTHQPAPPNRVVRESAPARREEMSTLPTPPPTTPIPEEEEEVVTNIPETRHASLTMQQVLASWENVKKRTMQKNSLLGTYVSMCDVVGIEEEGEHTIIVIRAAKPLHFKSIKEGDRPKDVEWALTTEFSIPCKIRVLPPGQAYSGSRAHNSVGTVAPLQSAYREPAQPIAQAEMRPTFQPQAEKYMPPSTPSVHSSTTTVALSKNSPPPALARQQGVRENKKVVLSKEELGHKAKQDPVVQEFVRTFQANIADIQPK